MVAGKPASPLAALQRWLAQIQYNQIRRVESMFPDIKRDDKKLLRGILVAEDLCLTRQRMFYVMSEDRVKATPVPAEFVAANYNLAEMQARYRSAQEAWKSQHRRAS